ncbi:hypothetical protein FNF31_00511 [Cafeteria roenbergensis]|uniref:Peptidase S54 rhomboid domain-containing protein n=1 Tax=Cafeteria roenbergensis TaxID=33653 RepID=A0A5A8DRF3_CAFRO|nr:hypothetical protein FNF28_05619 [Cafeteria roenbergensis]KAA0168012.1 hypothetical protein FNF31_00511 [Cafeteria roenbergensis]
MANQPDPPQGEGQTNWFQDWSARTPIVSRSLLIAIVGGALLAFLAGIADVFSNVPVLVLGSFQVWRLFTYPLFESSFFTLLFTLLSFSTQGPKLELRMGSAAMAASVAALTVLAGLAYILFAVVLAFNPLVPMPDYLQTGSSGFWPILIGLITLDCWAQPEGTRRLLCFPCQIANRYFPLAFIGLFAVIGGGVPFDLLAGFAVAAVMSTSRAPFPCAVPTDAVAARLENGLLRSLAASPGFQHRHAR